MTSLPHFMPTLGPYQIACEPTARTIMGGTSGKSTVWLLRVGSSSCRMLDRMFVAATRPMAIPAPERRMPDQAATSPIA